MQRYIFYSTVIKANLQNMPNPQTQKSPTMHKSCLNKLFQCIAGEY